MADVEIFHFCETQGGVQLSESVDEMLAHHQLTQGALDRVAAQVMAVATATLFAHQDTGNSRVVLDSGDKTDRFIALYDPPGAPTARGKQGLAAWAIEFGPNSPGWYRRNSAADRSASGRPGSQNKAGVLALSKAMAAARLVR